MLRLDSLGVEFSGLRALDGVDLAVGPREAVARVGPNGSGKTTLLNAICGNVPAASGGIILGRRRIDGLKPHRIARLGVARALQHPRPYARMTVAENLAAALAAEQRRGLDAWGLGRAAAHARNARIAEVLALSELEQEAELQAGTLSLAARRRLNLAQALVRRPLLLLLDEPAGGLAVEEVQAMADLLRTRVLPGRAAIVIDHDLDLLLGLTSRYVVLQAGRKIADGGPEMLSQPAVRDALYGGLADARS